MVMHPRGMVLYNLYKMNKVHSGIVTLLLAYNKKMRYIVISSHINLLNIYNIL